MRRWSVQGGLLKLVQDHEALLVVCVVRHSHGNSGWREPPEIRVADEGGEPFSLKGDTEALCERNARRAEEFLHIRAKRLVTWGRTALGKNREAANHSVRRVPRGR